jgi:hypothetical protein
MTSPGETGRLTVAWTAVGRDTDGRLEFDWELAQSDGARLSDDEIEQILTGVAERI